MLEQLFYAWSDQGLEGRDMFQVVAASPGLINGNDPIGTLARKLCKHPDPKERLAVSFGWIDSRGYRFVFNRFPLPGLGPDGRPGHFAAHIIVSPISDLDKSYIFEPAAQGLWWDGKTFPTSSTLPVLPAQAIGISAERIANTSRTEEALAKVLLSNATGSIATGWAELYAAVRGLYLALPQVFEKIKSFSSFETGETADWFNLVGKGFQDRFDRVDVGVLSCARLILSDRPGDRKRIRFLLRSASLNESLVLRDFALTYGEKEALRQLSIDDNRNRYCSLLATSAIVEDFLDEVEVRQRVLKAIVKGSRDVEEALVSGAKGISSKALERIGMELTSIFLQEENDLIQLQKALEVCVRLGNNALSGLATVAVDSLLDQADKWPVKVMSTSLKLRNTPTYTINQLLNSVASSIMAEHILLQDDLAPGYTIDIVVRGLENEVLDPQRIDVYARKLSSEHRRTLAVELGFSPRIFELIDRFPSAWSKEILLLTAPRATHDHLGRLCIRVLDKMSTSERRILISELSFRLKGKIPDEVASFADELLATAVRQSLRGSDPLPPIERLNLLCSNSDYGRLWRHTFEILAASERLDLKSTLLHLTKLFRSSNRPVPDELLQFSIETTVRLIRSIEDARKLLLTLKGGIDSKGLELLVNGATRIRGLNQAKLYVLALSLSNQSTKHTKAQLHNMLRDLTDSEIQELEDDLQQSNLEQSLYTITQQELLRASKKHQSILKKLPKFNR